MIGIFRWFWQSVVVYDGAEVEPLRRVDPTTTAQASTLASLAGTIVYTGDGYSNTDFGAQGANAAMEVALNTHYPMWRNSSEWRRWQRLDLSDPYYRYAALLNVFQYANPEGYAFKRNPSDPRQLGFFPQ